MKLPKACLFSLPVYNYRFFLKVLFPQMKNEITLVSFSMFQLLLSTAPSLLTLVDLSLFLFLLLDFYKLMFPEFIEELYIVLLLLHGLIF